MRNITLEDVNEAIKRIDPVPESQEERDRRLREELEKIAGQTRVFANESGENVYSPLMRCQKFIYEAV